MIDDCRSNSTEKSLIQSNVTVLWRVLLKDYRLVSNVPLTDRRNKLAGGRRPLALQLFLSTATLRLPASTHKKTRQARLDKRLANSANPM